MQGGSLDSARLLGGGPVGRTAGEVGGNRHVRAGVQEALGAFEHRVLITGFIGKRIHPSCSHQRRFQPGAHWSAPASPAFQGEAGPFYCHRLFLGRVPM